jgi:predicted HAD superfamily Cof-like phosphohydrolase
MELRAAFGLVEEFHRAFGLPVSTTPVAAVPPDLVALRASLFSEELEEYRCAAAANDAVAVADALTDMLYVLMGTYLSHGMQGCADELLAEVHRSNMSKLDEAGHAIVRDGKVRKSARFSPPQLDGILARQADPD